MLTAKQFSMKHVSEETPAWTGVWVILDYFACSWGWTEIKRNPFWLPVGNWGGSVSVQGLHSLMLLLLWSLKWAASSSLLGFMVSASGYRRMIWLWGQEHKIKTNCALLSLMWGREAWKRVSKVSNLWEWLLERWVKAGVEIMLFGLLHSSWEGQTAFHALTWELTALSLSIALPQCIKELVSGEAMVLSICPKEEFTASICCIHPSLNESYLGPKSCTLFSYRFVMKDNVLSDFFFNAE